PKLYSELQEELPGILNWSLEGWRDYQEKGLIVPDALKQAKETLKTESNDFSVFLETFFAEAPLGKVTRKDAYDAFKIWWEANHPGNRYPPPDSNRFAAEMRKLVIGNTKIGESKSTGERYWTGISPKECFHKTLDDNRSAPISY